MKNVFIFCLLFSAAAISHAQYGSFTGGKGIVYVDETKSGDGSSWANAYPNLADPLRYAAKEAGHGITEIWVAAGTYCPLHNAADVNSGNSRDQAFVLVEGIKIYGGFVPAQIPVGTSLPAFGTPGRNGKTILSGDLAGDDIPGDLITNRSDNAHHVVIGVNISNATLLDGLTITGGNADGVSGSITVNGNSIGSSYGGGMRNNNNSSPVLNHVTISGNTAGNNVSSGGGGGMYNRNSSPMLNYVTISNNMAVGSAVAGGGMENDNSSPTLNHVTISGNIGQEGGGMFNLQSSPVFNHVTVSGNTAIISAGGMYNLSSSPTLNHVIITENGAERDGGGMYNNNSSPVFTNAVITNNVSKRYGGGMGNTSSSSPMIVNATISGNSAIKGGGMYQENNASPILINSIVWGNTAPENPNVYNDAGIPSFSYSLIEGSGGSNAWDTTFGTDIVYNIDVDPQFENPGTGDYRLKAGSHAIDAGNNQAYSDARNIADFTGETDLAGNPRLTGNDIDLGAYEHQIQMKNIEITLDRTEIYLLAGATTNITATVTGSEIVEWNSNNPKVAAVSNIGTVTAVSPGTAVITASAGTIETACTVKVIAPGNSTIEGTVNNAGTSNVRANLYMKPPESDTKKGIIGGYVLLATTVPNDNGEYKFEDLPEGSYKECRNGYRSPQSSNPR